MEMGAFFFFSLFLMGDPRRSLAESKRNRRRCVCECVPPYSQELLQAVLDAPLVDGEESRRDLVDGFGQAVDVVAVACRGQQTHTLATASAPPD